MATVVIKNLMTVSTAEDQVWNTGCSAVGDPHVDEALADAGKATIANASAILPELKDGQTKVAIFGLSAQYVVLDAGDDITLTADDDAAKEFYKAQAVKDILKVTIDGEEVVATSDDSADKATDDSADA